MRDAGEAHLPDWLVDAYAHAVFEVYVPGGQVTLGVGTSVDGDAGRLPGASLTIVTAYNPGTRRPADASNALANQRLEERLRGLGKTYHPAAGRSPDGSHSEPSFAVEGLSRDEARALGALFRQAAVFYWHRGRGELLWSGAQ